MTAKDSVHDSLRSSNRMDFDNGEEIEEEFSDDR